MNSNYKTYWKEGNSLCSAEIEDADSHVDAIDETWQYLSAVGVEPSSPVLVVIQGGK